MNIAQSEVLNCFVPDSMMLKPNRDGVLRGLSFVVKDLIAIKGHTSSFGHSQWRLTHEPSKENASVIDLLLNSGATMRGITKMDQLAYSVIGNIGEGEQPLNPLYPDRFAGGSSSGSASAVAGKIAEIGIGTDTGGSIRIPAAACGIFGMRPTHSFIDTSGIIPWAQSFDVVGILTRNATILRNTLSVLTSKATKTKIKSDRVLVSTGMEQLVDKKLLEVVERAGEMISKKLDAPIQTIDLSTYITPDITDIFARIQGREIWANHHTWIENNIQYLTEDVQVRLERCKLASEAPKSEIIADENARNELSKRISDLLGETSLLILSVLPTLMPLHTSSLETQRDFRSKAVRLMAPSGFSGMPEIVIPFRDNTNDITTGIGILAPKGEDELLCQTAIKIATNKEIVELV